MTPPKLETPRPDGEAPAKPKKKPRTVVNRPKDRPGQFERLRGCFDQPVLWEWAALIPPQAADGQRRKLPSIFYAAMPSFAGVWGSFSAAESAMAESEVWKPLCEIVCQMQQRYRPHDEPLDLDAMLSGGRLTAQNFHDARRTWLAPCVPLLEDVFERYAAAAAREVGHADPEGAGSHNHLVRERTLIGDGKVTREPGSRYRTLRKDEERPEEHVTHKTHVIDVRTGEIIGGKKMVGDAHLYLTGAGAVVGFKTVRLSIRNNRTNSTIVVAVRRPDTKDEAACAVQAAIDVQRRLPGLLAVSYDTAMRGTHIRDLARRSRLITVAPVAAASNTKGGGRREKEIKVAEVPHQRPDGSPCTHTFYAHGGRLCEQLIDSHGNRQLVPCDDPIVRFRANKTSHRQYLAWTVTCNAGQPEGTDPVKVTELSWTVTDDSMNFNVAENLRPLPPGSERYDEARGWRQTIENDNHQSDARKVQRRGRSSRAEWNHLNELGWAIMNNGIALQRHRREQAVAA